MDKIIILKDKSKYLIPSNSIVKNNTSNTLVVNDIIVPYIHGSIQIPKPKSIAVKTSKKTTTGFKQEGGDVITLSQYDDQLTLLRMKGYENEYDDDWCFENLEDEFAYKKFLRDWKPVIEIKVTSIEYTEFKFVEVLLSEYRSITPINTIVDKVEDQLFIYKPNRIEIVREASKITQYQLIDDNLNISGKEKTISLSNHSKFEYTKINGSYIQGEHKTMIPLHPYRGTYEECCSVRQKMINLMVGIITHYDGLLNKTKITAEEKGFILQQLEYLKNRVAQLNVLKKDEHSQIHVLVLLKELSNKIK